ncbi:MAG: choline kinase family protein [Porticoccaceae bacterium]|nr:choline kinase family protein [Porticoccaceae bacterium]
MSGRAASPSPEARLARALASWPRWRVGLRRAPMVVGRLPGGLTNDSWRLDTAAGPAVIRLNRHAGERLGIDRGAEARVLEAVAAAGIAPQLWHNDPKAGYLVTAFVPGRPWSPADMDDPRQRRRLAAVVDRYRTLPVALAPRDYLAYLDNYWQQLRVLGIPAPAELAARWQRQGDAIARWQRAGWPPVLVHHDLTPGNILDTGEGLVLIDWEYAALGPAALDDLALGGPAPPPVAELAALINDLWQVVRDAG